MSRWYIALMLSWISVLALGQSSSAEVPLPETMTFRLYPDGKGRGHQVDIIRIAHTGGKVTGRVTMHGVGQDRCSIQGHLAEGAFDGTKLVLRVKVEPGDNITCPMAFDLTRGPDSKFEGRYTNSQFAGNVKLD